MSAGEHDLLAIARAIVSPNPEASVDASLATEASVKLMSPAAMAVLEETLAKGVVRMLARLGGARAIIRADTGSTKPVRAHDIREAPVLAFGPYTFELLRWLARTPLGTTNVSPFTETPQTSGDQVCAYLTLRLVAGRRFEAAVAASPGLASPLSWLGFARSLSRYGTESTPTFDGLLATPDGRLVVECLGADLVDRWVQSTSWRPRDLLDLDLAARIHGAERQTLDAFLDAASKVDRWDLATFLVEAAFRTLPPGTRPEAAARRAVAPVRSGGTLRARTEARQRAGTLFQVLPRLQRHYESLALVRFIDDGYDVAQAILSSWSPLGREGFARAAAVVSELASIGSFGTTAET